jgi:hypothetical protein
MTGIAYVLAAYVIVVVCLIGYALALRHREARASAAADAIAGERDRDDRGPVHAGSEVESGARRTSVHDASAAGQPVENRAVDRVP